MSKRALVIYRRDLRIHDNTALITAGTESESVITVFVADPLLLDRWRNSEKRLRFLATRLQELSHEIAKHGGRLLVITGKPEKIVERMIREHKIDTVFINRDYTPIARRRDKAIGERCRQYDVKLVNCADQLLTEPESVLKDDGTPYSVFTPWHRRATQAAVPEPDETLPSNLKSVQGPRFEDSIFAGYADAESMPVTSLSENLTRLNDYESQRDFPARQATSQLSAHLRFGSTSIREVYWTAKREMSAPEPFLRQLYWRDFYHHIAWHHPHVFTRAFREKFNGLRWQPNNAALEDWKAGTTGFPIIDAGMRELKQTGSMHNRVRMITASFLVKNLHINWQTGEQYFAEQLIDYDPALNNGNWQWAASTGCDAQPWFRVFNPWRQQRRFDPDCDYIRQWVPELRTRSAKEIHNLEKQGLEKQGGIYLPQIVDLKQSAETFKAMAGSL